MAVARYRGQGSLDDDESTDYTSGFGNAGDPSGYTPDDESLMPQTMSYDEWRQTPEAKAFFAKIPAHMRGDVEAKIRRQFGQYSATQLKESIPGVIEASKIDPYTELAYYGKDNDLDYDPAIEALYDPTTGTTTSAFADLDFIGPQTRGREAQSDSLDFLDTLLANGGRDAVSDAYYEGQRSDAEQAARAQREAAQQNLEERGMDSGGLSLLAELMAARDVGTNANRAAMESSAMQQKRRDAANAARGSLGGQLYGQDMSAADMENSFGLNKAAGTDQWEQFFADMQADYGRDKAGMMQSEIGSNWERDNAVDDQNAGLRNQALYYNKGLPITEYEMFTGAEGEEYDRSKERMGDIAREDAEPTGGEKALGMLGSGLSTAAKVYKFFDDDEEEKRK